ncbi:MAG: S41 family peptidase, partial [Myxococcota bacterium]
MRDPRVLLLLTVGCFAPTFEDTPENNLRAMWQDMDQRYGGFATKDVDWDASLQTARDALAKDDSPEGLLDALEGMITPLDDGHVFVYRIDTDDFRGSFNEPRESETLWNYALANAQIELLGTLDEQMVWGRIGGFGYVRLEEMDLANPVRKMRRALDAIGEVDGLIVDVRGNPGGTDRTAHRIAGCFADRSRVTVRARLRDGPEHDDFTDPISFTTDPVEACGFGGRVAVLTDTFTSSAAEVFTMAMRVQPRVTIIGEPSMGALSDAVNRELPNGWVYGIAIGDWRDDDDVSFEGRGVPVDIPALNTPEEFADGL